MNEQSNWKSRHVAWFFLALVGLFAALASGALEGDEFVDALSILCWTFVVGHAGSKSADGLKDMLRKRKGLSDGA